MGIGDGDWGLGIGDWAKSPIPNPQSPNSYINKILFINKSILLRLIILLYKFNYLL